MKTTFESAYAIGQHVMLSLNQEPIEAVVRTVTFTTGKVRYSVWLVDLQSTLHNIDSALITEGLDKYSEMAYDNYS